MKRGDDHFTTIQPRRGANLHAFLGGRNFFNAAKSLTEMVNGGLTMLGTAGTVSYMNMAVMLPTNIVDDTENMIREETHPEVRVASIGAAD